MMNQKVKLQRMLDRSLLKAVKNINENTTKEAVLKDIEERENQKKNLWASMSPGLKRKLLMHIERRHNAKK